MDVLNFVDIFRRLLSAHSKMAQNISDLMYVCAAKTRKEIHSWP